MRPRLVATDLDGTLLRRDGSVSDRTRSALQGAEDAGLVVAFVTGRPPRWLDAVVEETGHLGVAVGANGAVLYDLHTEQVLSVHALDAATVHELACEIRAAFPGVHFAVEYTDGFAAEPGYVHDWEINPPTDRRGEQVAPPVVGNLEQLASRPAVKLLAKDRAADVDTFLRSADVLLAGRASVTHSSRFGLLEIAAAGVTKATGLAELAARHDIAPAEVIAIGDMPNDVPMLLWAGKSYAVANAHPAAKAAADHVVGNHEDDAVAIVIESLLR
ncbi:MAG: Cof-type HAD-IIB family hydrolase [Actinomycetota bacterium]|nr:Cof-type HAD-IIB family hydrolase [Actinomycetota bacterium]